jgi:hypothetical protein
VTGAHRKATVWHFLGLGGLIFLLCAGMIAFGLYLVGVL